MYSATSSVDSNGNRHFEIKSWAPTPGTYLVYGSTYNNAGNPTPIPAGYAVMDQPGYISSTYDVPPGVDMSNGITVDFLGPNGNDNPFDNSCDSGQFAISWDPGAPALDDPGAGFPTVDY